MSGIEVAPASGRCRRTRGSSLLASTYRYLLRKIALRNGAYGYVVKSDAGLDLLSAIEAAHEGRSFVSRTLQARGWT